MENIGWLVVVFIAGGILCPALWKVIQAALNRFVKKND